MKREDFLTNLPVWWREVRVSQARWKIMWMEKTKYTYTMKGEKNFIFGANLKELFTPNKPDIWLHRDWSGMFQTK